MCGWRHSYTTLLYTPVFMRTELKACMLESSFYCLEAVKYSRRFIICPTAFLLLLLGLRSKTILRMYFLLLEDCTHQCSCVLSWKHTTCCSQTDIDMNKHNRIYNTYTCYLTMYSYPLWYEPCSKLAVESGPICSARTLLARITNRLRS